MARRSEHSLEELKALVLDAAETIIIEEGFTKLKVRRIAIEIGYTVGSIYMVFTNMADLIMHINARTLDAIAAQLEQVQAPNTEQSVEAIALNYLSYASQNFYRWSNIFDYLRSSEAKIPEWFQEKVDHVFIPLEIQFAAIAPELSEEQKKQAARALWGAIHGNCVISLTHGTDKVVIKDLEATIILLVRSFLRGWLASSDK